MRQLLRPSGCTAMLRVAYLTPGYTFVPVNRKDIHRFMQSRRIISVKYTGVKDSELFERPEGAIKGWLITDKWGQYKFTDLKATSRLMRRFEVDYSHPVEFTFKPYLKKEYEYTLRLTRNDGRYYMGIPWTLYDSIYSYPVSILNGELSEYFDLSQIHLLHAIVKNPKIHAYVRYFFERRLDGAWIAKMSIDHEKISEPMSDDALRTALKSIPVNTIKSVYITHRVIGG